MKKRVFHLGIALAAMFVAGVPTAASAKPAKPVKEKAAECSAEGNVKVICGVEHAEDLQRIPGSEWIVTSGLEQKGIRFVNTRDFRHMQVFPSPTAGVAFDRQKFSECPGPTAETAVDFHGINLRIGSNGVHTLYAVRHASKEAGSRESIEVFAIDARQKVPAVTWIGCVPAPTGVVLNSVTPLPGDGFISSNFNWPDNNSKAADFPKGWTNGQLWEWQPGEKWHIVPGSEFFPGPNGLEASRDGKWLYINLWPAQQVLRLSRGQTPVRADLIPVPFHPDNIHWNEDGSLQVAGQGGTLPRLLECMNLSTHFGKACPDVSANVIRLDPESLSITPVLSYPGQERLTIATVGLTVGKEIWLSSDFFDRIVRYPLP